MKPFIKLIAIALIASLAACASTRGGSAEEGKIKEVAILNLAPENLHIDRVGFLGGERRWVQMNGALTSTILTAIRTRLELARPQWTIKEITYDKPTLSEQINRSGFVMSNAEERIKTELAQIAQAHQLDALIVVNTPDYRDMTGDGIGILLRVAPNSSIQSALVHSNISIKIVNPKGEVIAKQGWGSLEEPKKLDVASYGISYDLARNTTPEVLDRLRSESIEHLKKSTERSLDQLGIK